MPVGGSIIGCGLPLVKSSSPKGRKEGVFDAAIDIFQAEFRIGLDVAVDIAVFFPSPRTWFRHQRTAQEQATNVFLLGLQTRTHPQSTAG